MTLVICGNLRFIQKKLKFIENWPQYAVDQIRFTLDMWFCWESNQHQQMDLSGFAFLGNYKSVAETYIYQIFWYLNVAALPIN